jgi:hypothetical protein
VVASNWYDEITMEDDAMPVAIFTEGEPILPPDHSMFETIKRNPLMLLANKKLIQSLATRLAKPLGMRTVIGIYNTGQYPILYFYFLFLSFCILIGIYLQHMSDFYILYSIIFVDFYSVTARGNPTHPETRVPIAGFVAFGDDNSHVKANKACIAKVFFGTQKMAGNYAQWMMVFWHVVRSAKAYVSESIGGIADSYFKKLLVSSHETVLMGLDGTGSRPTNRVPLGTALLYAAASSAHYVDHPERDVMREIFGAWGPMKDALALAEIEVPEGSDERINLVAIASKLLDEVKFTPGGIQTVRHKIVASYAKTLDLLDGGLPVILDEKVLEPTFETKLRGSLLANGSVHPGLAGIGSVRLPLDASRNLREPLELGSNFGCNEYLTLRDDLDDELVCPKTMRPYTTRPVDFDADSAYKTTISMHRRMLDFFVDRKCFPEGNDGCVDFIRMLEKKDAKRFNGVLPPTIDNHFNVVLRSMHVAMNKRLLKYGPESCEYDSMIRDIKLGCARVTRAEMELHF